MKNILIICKDIYPLQNPRAFRVTELVDELYRRGHVLTVVCAMKEKDFNLYKEKYPHMKIKNLVYPSSFLDSVFFQKNKFLFRVFNKLFNHFLYLLFHYPTIKLLFSVRDLLENNKVKYDLLFTISNPFPIHWGAALAKNNKNSFFPDKWIADCGDPYMGNEIIRPLFYFSILEKMFCKKADKITIPVEIARKAYYSEFHDKIEIIPQGFDFSNIKLAKYIVNTIPTFIYAGAFYYGKRDPRPFLDFLCSVNKDFLFIVYTDNASILRGYEIKLGKKLKIENPVTRADILVELSKADFLFNIENETTNQVPSKLIDYTLSKRPILSLKMDGNFNEFFNFLDGNYAESIRVETIQDYNIINVVDKFLSIVKD